jgi:hypothetical protein
MADHSDWRFVREQSAGRWGSLVLLGLWFEKEKHHVLHGHLTKKMTVDVIGPGSGDSLTTSARVGWSFH